MRAGDGLPEEQREGAHDAFVRGFKGIARSQRGRTDLSQGRELRAAAVQFGKFRTGIECVGACVGEARVEALFLEPEPDLLGERHESVPLFTPRFARRRRAFRGKMSGTPATWKRS